MMESNAQQEFQPIPSETGMSIRYALFGDIVAKKNREAEIRDMEEKLAAGTHRFSINYGQAPFKNPDFGMIDIAKDRERRMKRNAAAIKVYDRYRAEVTEDGFIIRDRVNANG